MEKLYTVFKTRPEADCGSDHELLIAKFRLKLTKVGKTTRPFRYDPNQIPYDYTVEVRNRFKGLDLIDRVPEELWTKVCDIVKEAVIKTIPKKRKHKKIKWLSEEILDARKRSSKHLKPYIVLFESRSTTSLDFASERSFFRDMPSSLVTKSSAPPSREG